MLGYLIVAAIFWFNPLISNVDLLPDLFGYLLVIKAFSKCSYIYDYAEDICAGAKKMCIITGIKLATVFVSSSLDTSMLLLLSFSFGVVEIIFGLPFLFNLFYAYSKMVAPEDEETYALTVGGVKYFTVIYFVTKLVLACLPDLTALGIDYSRGSVEFSYLRFRPIFIIISVFICSIIGIAWLIVYLRNLRRVVNKAAVSAIMRDFENGLANKKSIFVAKDSIRAMTITAIASVFILDFKVGYTNVDVFQDFIFTLAATLGFLYLFIKGVYKLNKSFIPMVGALVLHVLANVYENNANNAYFEKYNYASMLKISEAEDMYITVCISGFLSATALVLSVFMILWIMRSNARANIINNSHLFTHSDIEYYLKEFNGRTKRNVAVTVSFAILSGAVYVLLVLFRPYAEWMILVNLVCEAVFIICFINSTLYIHDEVYKRILSFA